MKKDKSKAIVRQCDGCGIITAMSVKASKKVEKELALSNQTVTVISLEQARKLWSDFGGYCKCKE